MRVIRRRARRAAQCAPTTPVFNFWAPGLSDRLKSKTGRRAVTPPEGRDVGRTPAGIIAARGNLTRPHLLPLYERERAAGRALVLGVVLETAGSTYRKPGALMLIAADGNYAGLLSGGCLEGDLREHASTVRQTGVPQVS